jgi:hypothetical protein
MWRQSPCGKWKSIAWTDLGHPVIFGGFLRPRAGSLLSQVRFFTPQVRFAVPQVCFFSSAGPFSSSAGLFYPSAGPFFCSAGSFCPSAGSFFCSAGPFCSSAGPFFCSADLPKRPTSRLKFPARDDKIPNTRQTRRLLKIFNRVMPLPSVRESPSRISRRVRSRHLHRTTGR